MATTTTKRKTANLVDSDVAVFLVVSGTLAGAKQEYPFRLRSIKAESGKTWYSMLTPIGDGTFQPPSYTTVPKLTDELPTKVHLLVRKMDGDTIADEKKVPVTLEGGYTKGQDNKPGNPKTGCNKVYDLPFLGPKQLIISFSSPKDATVNNVVAKVVNRPENAGGSTRKAVALDDLF